MILRGFLQCHLAFCQVGNHYQMSCTNISLSATAFPIERITNPVQIDGVTYYEIKWMGYDEPSLEPEVNPDIRDIVTLFGVSVEGEEVESTVFARVNRRRNQRSQQKEQKACPRRNLCSKPNRRTVRKPGVHRTHQIKKNVETSVQTNDIGDESIRFKPYHIRDIKNQKNQ